jgi:RimJ/RimL family protein N-acetyltransferase
MSDPSMSDVLLREVTEDDLPVLFEHQREPEANRMAAFAARNREAFMAHWTKILADEDVTTKTIVVDGEVAGNVGSWGPPEERLVGYWIGREHWGKGVATAALSAFLGEERRRPLYAHVAEHNVASRRVLEKCGFVVVGRDTVTDEAGEIEELILELRAEEIGPVR